MHDEDFFALRVVLLSCGNVVISSVLKMMALVLPAFSFYFKTYREFEGICRNGSFSVIVDVDTTFMIGFFLAGTFRRSFDVSFDGGFSRP